MKESSTILSVRYLAKSVSRDQINGTETFKNQLATPPQGPVEDCLVSLLICSYILHHSPPPEGTWSALPTKKAAGI